MKYYDIVLKPCEFDGPFAKRLGFERVFKADGKSRGLFAGRDRSALIKAAQRGSAIAITDFSIDREVLAKARDNEAALCIPISAIAAAKGLEQARLLHRASELIAYAYRKRMEVSFASLAESRLFMDSRMQLIEMAKALGATEEQARRGVGEANVRIIEGCEAHDED